MGAKNSEGGCAYEFASQGHMVFSPTNSESSGRRAKGSMGGLELTYILSAMTAAMGCS